MILIYRSSSFLNNGSILSEDLIASCDGKSNHIRCYSADEPIKATNNFHPSCLIHGCASYTMFKGSLDEQSIIIKKFAEKSLWGYKARSRAIRDIVISTQMSNHKNVLKLLGCCLEFGVPALVHEYAAQGVLNDKGGFGDNESLPWKTRLRIAKQLANALTYLHTAFPRPIVHRDIAPSCIFLDDIDDYVPKLCNFSLSITIPPKQLHADVEIPIFRSDYADPTYMRFNYVSEKTDVYCFGILLLVFLTGQDALVESVHIVPYANTHAHACGGHIRTIVDPKIFDEVGGGEQEQQQLNDFRALALLCTQEESEVRPYMIDVAKELVRIEKSILPC